APTKTDYTFEGWATTNDATEPNFDETTVVNSDIRVYAIWEEVPATTYYTVTFAPGSQGTFTPVLRENLEYGEPTPTPPATPGQSGYTFTGWDPAVAQTVTGDATYTAQWRQNSTPPSPRYEMSITKEADNADVVVGNSITYTITVTNTGNRTLTDITVVDEMVDLDEVIDTLNVGASITFTRTYLTTEIGELENIATATSNESPDVEATVIVFVDDVSLGVPELIISKTVVDGSKQVFNPGDDVEFLIVVTNQSDERLEDITIKDDLAGFETTISLDALQSVQYIVAVSIDEDFDQDSFTNFATASHNRVGTVEDTATVDVEKLIEVTVDEVPLAIPDTGGSSSMFAYGAGAMLSLLGLLKKKRR
ncbi:MAG: InlB B-repeat-containing protein, partial [Dethiosulfatibacter sp.]|nr:InlB B-repeat-containing protein [Dethiosulfatibacter sp.]